MSVRRWSVFSVIITGNREQVFFDVGMTERLFAQLWKAIPRQSRLSFFQENSICTEHQAILFQNLAPQRQDGAPTHSIRLIPLWSFRSHCDSSSFGGLCERRGAERLSKRWKRATVGG